MTIGFRGASNASKIFAFGIAGAMFGCAASDGVVKRKFSLPSLNQNAAVCRAQAKSLYIASVNPILEKKCASCHDKQAFRLQSSQADSNYGYAAGKGDLILVRGQGGQAHPGGAPLNQTDAVTISTWLEKEEFCRELITIPGGSVCSGEKTNGPAAATVGVTTNLSRSSGSAMYLRLLRLFPNSQTGKLNPKNFSLYEAQGLNSNIGRSERFTTVVSQLAVQNIAESVCTEAAKTAQGAAGAIFADDFILSGEAWPADPARALAMKVARNAWLYPYAASDPEVVELASLYSKAVNDAKTAGGLSAAAAEAAGRASMCLVALQAPQFWVGNTGELDVLRRVALEVGRQLPTPAEYDAFKKAADRSAYMRQYTSTLQAKPGYRAAVSYWHQDWLGLRPFSIRFDPRDIRTAASGVSTVSGFRGNVRRFGVEASGTDLANQSELEYMNRDGSNVHHDSEICENRLQDFDPRTTEIRWEQRNPAVSGSPFEVLGRWTRDGAGAWLKVGGQITLADGSKRNVGLDDVKFANMSTAAASGSPTQYRYVEGGLVGTPMEHFYAGDRRVRRFAPSGEQNGYSPVRLFHSGAVVYTCNTLSRFPSTCAYRATKSESRAHNYWQRDNLNRSADRTGPMAWSAGGTEWINSVQQNPAGEVISINKTTRQYPIVGFTIFMLNSLALPEVLESFRCGAPDPSEVAKGGMAGYNEDLAYPRGYETFGSTTIPSPDAFNSVAYNPYFETADGVVNSSAEHAALQALQEDLRQEPLRIIDEALNRGDYRQMLTANYTMGTDYLKLMLSTQGYFLPFYPPGYTPSSNPLGVRKIEASELGPIYQGWYQSSKFGNSSTNALTPRYLNFAATRPDRSVAPKTLAGILTTTGFMAPTAGTMRTVSARVFVRLLCDQPSAFTLSASAKELHAKYIKQASHVKPGCVSCHAHLDPLASAFSAAFAKDPTMRSGTMVAGEFEDYISAGYGFYGLRGVGNPAEGAFMGKKVTGIRETAEAIANSPEFARCAVSKAFSQIFGREVPTAFDCLVTPSHPDCQLVRSVAEKFRSPSDLNFNYDRMIQELVASPLNVRKN